MNLFIFLLCFGYAFCETNNNNNNNTNLIPNYVKNLRISKLTSCKASLDGGKIMDLSSLDNPNNPL